VPYVGQLHRYPDGLLRFACSHDYCLTPLRC
jgi:hypothetical protein